MPSSKFNAKTKCKGTKTNQCRFHKLDNSDLEPPPILQLVSHWVSSVRFTAAASIFTIAKIDTLMMDHTGAALFTATADS